MPLVTLLKVFVLCALRKLSKRTATSVEVSAITVSLASAHHRRRRAQAAAADPDADGHHPFPEEGAPTSPLGALSRSLCDSTFLAAALIQSLRLAVRLLRLRQPARVPPDALLADGTVSDTGVDANTVAPVLGLVIDPSAPPPPLPPLAQAPRRKRSKSAPSASPAVPPPLPREQQWTVTAPQVTHTYREWVDLFRTTLRHRGLLPLPRGFDADGLELSRFLLSCSLHKARHAAEAERAVERAVERLQLTVGWWRGTPFLPPMQLAAEWDNIVWWEAPSASGAAAAATVADSDGAEDENCMWLCLDVGAALARTRAPGCSPQQCADAVVSQVEYGARTLVTQATVVPATTGSATLQGRESSSGAPVAVPVGTSGRFNVLIACGSANMRTSLRLLGLLKTLSGTIHRHYPGRLRALYLTDMPSGPMRMSIETILTLLPVDTRRKIKVCNTADMPQQPQGRILHPAPDMVTTLRGARSRVRAAASRAAAAQPDRAIHQQRAQDDGRTGTAGDALVLSEASVILLSQRAVLLLALIGLVLLLLGSAWFAASGWVGRVLVG